VDTAIHAAANATEATNRKGVYTFTNTTGETGLHDVIVLSGTTPVLSFVVRLTGTAITVREVVLDSESPARSIGRITAAGGGSTTSVPTSACSPSGAVANQFTGASLVFDVATTTPELRGVRVAISASSNAAAPTFTVDTLPAAPAAGDTASIV